MVEYISREDVLDIASQYCPDDDGSCSKADVDPREMLDEIEALPSADVQPVKHGRWELTNNPSFRKCSECGAWWGKEFTTNNYVNYCPRCGVNMREPNE